MFARVASFEGGDSERRRQLNDEQMRNGSLNPPEGIKSVLLLEDNEAGKSMFITFFDTREAIAAAEARFEAMGDEIPEEIRGKRVAVGVYEVAFSMEASEAEAGV